MIENKCRQLVKVGQRWTTAVLTLQGSNRPLTDNSDDKPNTRAYSIQQFQSGYGNKWHGARPFHAVTVNAFGKEHKNKSYLPYKREYPPSVHDVTVVKPVTELFTDVVDYRIYRRIKK